MDVLSNFHKNNDDDFKKHEALSITSLAIATVNTYTFSANAKYWYIIEYGLRNNGQIYGGGSVIRLKNTSAVTIVPVYRDSSGFNSGKYTGTIYCNITTNSETGRDECSAFAYKDWIGGNFAPAIRVYYN